MREYEQTTLSHLRRKCSQCTNLTLFYRCTAALER